MLPNQWTDLEIGSLEGINVIVALYEGANDNYNYEKSVSSTITLTLNNPRKILTIG
jgi:hypothetical protein